MLSASQGQSSTTLATVVVWLATWRLSSARARRTRLACSSARRCCGAATDVAVSPMILPGNGLGFYDLPDDPERRSRPATTTGLSLGPPSDAEGSVSARQT